jgi:hypothetical protein
MGVVTGRPSGAFGAYMIRSVMLIRDPLTIILKTVLDLRNDPTLQKFGSICEKMPEIRTANVNICTVVFRTLIFSIDFSLVLLLSRNKRVFALTSFGSLMKLKQQQQQQP